MMIYEQNFKSENNGGVRDTRLDNIGKKVKTEYGDGIIRAVEIFKGMADHRYLIETPDMKNETFKKMFPDNRMAFWENEIEFIK